MSLKKRVIGNVGANLYGQFVTIAAQLVQVPLFLHFWGKLAYGQWLVLSAIPTYIALADAGFGTVAGNEMAMRVANGEQREARRVLHTLTGFVLAITFFSLAFILLAAFLLPWASWLRIQGASDSQVHWILLWLGIMTLATLHSTIYGAVYRAGYRNARFVFVANTSRLVLFIATAVSLPFVHSMMRLAFILASINVLTLALIYVDVWRGMPELRMGIRGFDMEKLRELLRPSLSFMLFPIGNAVYYQGFTIAVNSVLGPVAVVVFNTLRTLTRTITQGVTVIKHSVWPELSYLIGSGKIIAARKLHRISMQGAFLIALAAVTVILYFGKLALKTWTHGQVSVDYLTLSLFLGGVFVNGLWFTSSGLLQAVNKHEGLAIRYLLSACFGIALTAFACNYMGVRGAAIGMLLVECYLLPYTLRVAASILCIDVSTLFRELWRFDLLRDDFRIWLAARKVKAQEIVILKHQSTNVSEVASQV